MATFWPFHCLFVPVYDIGENFREHTNLKMRQFLFVCFYIGLEFIKSKFTLCIIDAFWWGTEDTWKYCN